MEMKNMKTEMKIEMRMIKVIELLSICQFGPVSLTVWVDLRIWDFEPVSLFIIYEHLPLRAAQVHTGFQAEKKRKRQLSPKLFHCHRTELNFSWWIYKKRYCTCRSFGQLRIERRAQVAKGLSPSSSPPSYPLLTLTTFPTFSESQRNQILKYRLPTFTRRLVLNINCKVLSLCVCGWTESSSSSSSSSFLGSLPVCVDGRSLSTLLPPLAQQPPQCYTAPMASSLSSSSFSLSTFVGIIIIVLVLTVIATNLHHCSLLDPADSAVQRALDPLKG